MLLIPSRLLSSPYRDEVPYLSDHHENVENLKSLVLVLFSMIILNSLTS